MKKSQIWSVIGVLTLIIPLLFGILPEKTEAAGTAYYVNAESGDDNNTGTSPNQAWATLDKLEKTTFEAGDTIRLHENSVFEDTLHLDGAKNGEGADGAPIVLESYGDAGGKATINGNGEGNVEQMEKEDIYSTVTLYNASHWTIRDLAITNIGSGEDMNTVSQKDRVGLYVLAKENGLTQDIHVDNLSVSDVNGSIHAKDTGNGGIFFTVAGNTVGEVTRFHNISVTNCQVENVTRTGISVGSTSYAGMITDETEATTIDAGVIQQYGHSDVLIENNYVKQSGGDAIVPQFCYKPLIQYNVSDTASYSHSKWNLDTKNASNEEDLWQVNAGIWPWLCYYPNFQYNEAFNTVDNYDGEAFDCDSGTGTIYQYNYSHDNEGGFMLICSPKNFDSLIRYNISQNDRKHLFLVSNNLDPECNDPRYPGITEEETANVYNNTFYTGEGLDVTIMSQEEPGYVRMKNNIFYNEGTNTTPYWQPAHYGNEHPATIKYDHNLYYGYTNLPNNEKNPVIVKNPAVELTGAYNAISIPDESQHERGIEEDEAVEGEVMVAPGTGGNGLASVAGYQLSGSSPAINAGIRLTNNNMVDNGGHDYFGNGLTDEQTDIGAHEYVGEITPPTSSTEESSSTKPSSSSTEESSSTKPSSSSTEESSTTKPSSSSTEESSSTKPTSSSSTEESSSTKPSSSSTEESSSTKPTSSSSTEESSSTKPSSSSTEESSSTKPSSSSTEESSTTKPTSSSTEESSSTKPSSSSTEESSSTKPSSSSTEESSSTKPTSSSTEESSSTKPSSSSTEESSSTKPSSSSTEESSSTKPTSSSTEESNSIEPTSSSTKDGGLKGNFSNNLRIDNDTTQYKNSESNSTNKNLPKTGTTSNYLLIWLGGVLLVGSVFLLTRKEKKN